MSSSSAPAASIPWAVLRGQARDSGLGLLVLFGSRARGEAHPGSDWDFGAIASTAEELEKLRVKLCEALGTERVDVVDLCRASGLLRHRVASDGALIFESTPGAFLTFQFEVSRFWCDVEPVFRQAHADVLRGLSAS